MTMRPTDPIVGPSRGSAGTAKSYAKAGGADRPADVNAYLDAVYALCAGDDLPDAAVVVAQALQETSDPGPFQSHWWNARLNPAGMGIAGDPVENNASPTFADGEDAARAQVAHLLLYATGRIDRGGLTPADDPRYRAYRDAYGTTARATSIAALAGTWAVDEAYDIGICSHAGRCFPNLPDAGKAPAGAVVFGRVPFPPCADREIDSPPNTAWDDLGPREVKGVVLHRMVGTLAGTDTWFRGGGADGALTDYGVGVAATDGAASAGKLMRWNDPGGRRSPWASGPVSAPYGGGKQFVDRYGVNGVNRYTTALEISGNYETALDAKSRETIAAFVAYWADAYRLPYDEFPAVKREGGRDFVLWHQEFTIGTGKVCPGRVVMDETDALIGRAKTILQLHQTGGKPAPPASPAVPAPSFPPARIPAPDLIRSQGIALTINPQTRYKAVHGGRFRTYPDRRAPAGTPTPYARGKVYTLPYAAVVDGERWLLSSAGSWAQAKNFVAVEG